MTTLSPDSFKNNVWGAKSYSDLTPSQKKLLFNSSMINSAYLIELMSSTPGDNPAPGTVMRRSSSLNLYDTIPQLRASDMPDNEYWQYYRSKYSDAATGGMTVFRDNTTAPMVHFLSAYMSNKSITNDDLKFFDQWSLRQHFGVIYQRETFGGKGYYVSERLHSGFGKRYESFDQYG